MLHANHLREFLSRQILNLDQLSNSIYFRELQSTNLRDNMEQNFFCKLYVLYGLRSKLPNHNDTLLFIFFVIFTRLYCPLVRSQACQTPFN